MPGYRIHRLKDHLRHQFRYGPHVSGMASVKPRDYEPGATVEAPTPYSAYFALRGSDAALELGDLLESDEGALLIFKFVGFEQAMWVLPQAKPEDIAATSESA